jgi:hypothetical protein
MKDWKSSKLANIIVIVLYTIIISLIIKLALKLASYGYI